MESIIKFFNQNQKELINCLENVKVNQEKTVIKYGSIDNEQLSLAFFIHGEPDPTINAYQDKVLSLFNCDDKELLEELNQHIKEIKDNFPFQISPYLKISKETEPTLHTFNFTINFVNEKVETKSS